MKLISKYIFLFIYYFFAKYLPTQPEPGWQIAYAIRRFLVQNIFYKYGKNIIVKKNAYSGKETGSTIGDNSQNGAYARIGLDVIQIVPIRHKVINIQIDESRTTIS